MEMGRSGELWRWVRVLGCSNYCVIFVPGREDSGR